ncbi:DUF6884 domain-containing protein [Methanobacterium sp. ACI-7]|uniref:DUF6884 domain-containing protein n=1 Tax=unclassified Methanobacterium TaxID=2627676 RepID=UPI0039C406CC
MRELCIVACGKKKIWDEEDSRESVKSKDMYTGTFTRKCIEYAQKFHENSYCILSAKYGFLFPEETVNGPYCECFHLKNTHPISTDELLKQISGKNLNDYERIVILGGKFYNEMIIKLFKGKEIYNPLHGCKGIGMMIKKLNELIG